MYISEAHPEDEWQMDSNVEEKIVFKQPKTFEERKTAAALLVDRLKYRAPLAIDGIDDGAGLAFGAWPERITALRAAVERGDAATLSRLAHGLKGAGGTVGARGLAVLCAELERADCAADSASALQLVGAIQREFDRVLEALRAEGLGEVASRIRAEAAGS